MDDKDTNKIMEETSFLYGTNAHYIEDLYARYLENPQSVDDNWKEFFEELGDDASKILKNAEGASWKKNGALPKQPEWVCALDGHWSQDEVVSQKKVEEAMQRNGIESDDMQQAARDSIHAIMMVRAYRMRGHLHANLDPLGLAGKKEAWDELHPSTYGFEEKDYERPIFLDHVLGLEFATVPQMLEILQRTYCSTLGVEFMHISNPKEKSWIQERIEGVDKTIKFSDEDEKSILTILVEAEGFEKFIDVKYKGTKRFGLDGAEAAIVALEQIIRRGVAHGVEDIVLGMPHQRETQCAC